MRVTGMCVSLLLAAVLFLAGCSSTPEPAPTPDVEAPAYVDVAAVAGEIAAYLIAGDVLAAEELISGVERSEDYEAVYSVLFDRAQALADQRDYDSSIRIDRFLVSVYPDQRSAQEALIYSLWLARAQSGEPHDAGTVKEIESIAAQLRADGEPAPVWVDIALTQAAIDNGNLDAARTAMARFSARWDREPPSLRAYATELERFIESHSQAN